MRGIKRPFSIKIIILASLLLYFTPQAVAWKPVSHVHLAEVARLDALDDGKVEIFLVDYESGEILSKLGDYEVEPNILKALREQSAYYRAGAFAADFIPDFLFSQLLVHPKRTRTSSDTWLKELWDGANRYYLPPESNEEAFTKAARIKAFVLGFLTHAAGDMYGHSYINEFAGGAWELNEIAFRHMFIEAYIDKRTPDTSPDFYSTSIAGLEDFIYDHMINKLDLTGYSDFGSGNFNIEDNVPARIFAGLSIFLESQINDLLNIRADYDRRYNAKVQEAENCKPTDLGCSRILLYRQAAAILVEKKAYALFSTAVILYCQNWIKDIDEGLKAFILPSYQAHHIFFQKPNTYYPSPDAALQKWSTDHLLSMVGLPDVVGQIVGYDLIMELIPQVLKDKFEEMKAFFFNYIMNSALGMTLQELEDMLNSITEPVFFNSVPTLFPNDGCWMSMSDFNLCELKIQDTAYDNPDERYDWHTFRPAYNTVTMNKLLLLSQAGLRQLLTDLGYSGDTSELHTPAILGFIDSFDRSNQGINPPEMVLAKDPAAYKKIFMRQRGVQLQSEAQGVPCGCRQPEEQKPDETQEEEVTFDDLAGKFSHIELSGKLHDMVVNDEFLVVRTELKKKGQFITVFSEPEGVLLWKRPFSRIYGNPGIFLFKDRIALALERRRPYRFQVFDANTGKKIDEIHPPIWAQAGRYLVSQYGDVYDMQKCLLYEHPAEEKADAKAIAGENVLYWTSTAKPPRKESLVLRSLDSQNALWKKTKLPEKERIFFRTEMVAGNRMIQNDFPVLFPIRIRYRSSREPFPFYFLKKMVKANGFILNFLA